MGTLENEEKARLLPIIFEELAWGDCGLMLGSMVTSFPSYAARLSGDESLIEQFDGRLGCWLATQPDRGCDVVDMDGDEIHPGTRQNRPNLHARIDGSEIVVTGQSSAWVSAAPFAETTLAFMPCDYGDGLYNENGSSPQISLLIDLDDPRVSKGKPLDKLGIRTLPQGEVFFDEVRVPMKNAVAQGDAAVGNFMGTLTFANMEMGFSFTGVARAAYELALEYVHERKQGGTELINHQSVRLRLFDIWRKVEACRAMSRRVAQYNFGPNGPHLLASVTSKTFVTQTCLEAVSESLQLFGGNGLTREYALEKLLRDARASLIADGENNMLSLKGADWISKWYQHNNPV
jgi:alkylation response protein AidB-like acyl-CoA dehydrogenase